MTAVFKISDTGLLQGAQLGTADRVAFISTSRFAWGWIGGFEGISNVFKWSRNLFISSGTFSPPLNLPASCEILTFEGIFRFEDYTSETFGGDQSSQIVGFTLCALDHELRLDAAIELFMNYFVPSLLGKEETAFPGLREALHTQLLDNGKKFINQGASRGLSERFYKALESSNISPGRVEPVVYWKGWRSEHYMIGGLLKWIGKGIRKAYFTRSAAVARTAIYLREVGYAIGAIDTWDGVGSRPAVLRGVILVTGGVNTVSHNELSTDEFMDDDNGPLKFLKPIFVSHYRFSTFGAMLANTLQARCEDSPETLQEYFDVIYVEISKKLSFSWKFTSEDPQASSALDMEVHAIPLWQTNKNRISSSALRLSSIYFANAATLLAPHYERITSPEAVRIVLAQRDRDDRTLGQRSDLVRFRVITASILISVVAQVAGKDFKNLHHATIRNLHKPRMMKNCAAEVEKLVTSGLSFSRIATLIAHLHCGTIAPRGPEAVQDEEVRYVDTGIIGWRNGCHAVLPALLFSLRSGPSSLNLGFRCADKFIGNIPVHGDGSVRSNKHGILRAQFRDSKLLVSLQKQEEDGNTETQLVQAYHNVSLGAPTPSPPDILLHLTIERPLDRSDPDLGLCGRVNGETIGVVGVLAVLRNLVQSHCNGSNSTETQLTETKSCLSAHSQVPNFFKVPASVWASSHRRPTGEPHYHMYIPVQGDAAWTVFLSGETNSRVVLYGCAICAAEKAEKGPTEGEGEKFLLIGYRG